MKNYNYDKIEVFHLILLNFETRLLGGPRVNI